MLARRQNTYGHAQRDAMQKAASKVQKKNMGLNKFLEGRRQSSSTLQEVSSNDRDTARASGGPALLPILTPWWWTIKLG